jgi:hypothetical protein
MVDWYFVFTHGLWILGLAMWLAAFSYHNWRRTELRIPLRRELRESSFRVPSNAGLLLAAVGFMLLESGRWWERAAWFIVACLFGWQAWHPKSDSTSDTDEGPTRIR